MCVQPSHIKVPLILSLTVCASFALAACGASRDTALVQTDAELLKATSQGDFQNTVAEADAHWEKRADLASLKSALETWEKAATMETTGSGSVTAAPGRALPSPSSPAN